MTRAERVGALARKEGLCTPFLGTWGSGQLGRAGDFCCFFQNLGEARAHSILQPLPVQLMLHAQCISWAPGRFGGIQVIFGISLLPSFALPPSPSLLQSVIFFYNQRVINRSPSLKGTAIKASGVTRDRRKAPWFFRLLDSRSLG